MKKILIISPDQGMVNEVQNGLVGNPYVFFGKESLNEAHVFLCGAGEIDVILVDASSLNGDPKKELTHFCHLTKGSSVMLLVDSFTRGLEVDAMLAGVAYVLEKPINGDLLSELISRHENSLRSSSGLISPTESDIRVKQVQDQENRMLQIARNFIELPRLAISTQAGCQKTISLLREMTGYRRIFLYFLKKKAGESTHLMAIGNGLWIRQRIVKSDSANNSGWRWRTPYFPWSNLAVG